MNPPIYIGSKISKNLEEECRAAMCKVLSRRMVHVQQVEESRNRKHIRAGNRSRQSEKNFSRKSSTDIRDNPRCNKGISNQGESSLSKDRYDRVPRQELRVGSVSNFMEESV